MKPKSLSVLCTFLIASVFTKHINFSDCGNKEIVFIDIDPCSSDPCDISVGDVYILSVQFKANENTSSVELTGTAKLPTGESYPLPAMDLCSSQRGLCPVKAGSTVTTRTSVDIPPFIQPANGVKIDAQLIGDGEKILACADFTVNIVQ